MMMMEVVVTTEAIRRAKIQSNRNHQINPDTVFTDWISFLSPNRQCQSTDGLTKYPRRITTAYDKHTHTRCRNLRDSHQH